jgi:hypothetical protein
MGLPASWVILSVTHIWLSRKACGSWNSKTYNRICGDDLIGQFTPKEYERYCLLAKRVGLIPNRKKTFISADLAVFKERPFHTVNGQLVQLEVIPLRSLIPKIEKLPAQWTSGLSDLIKGKRARRDILSRVVMRQFGHWPSHFFWPIWAGGYGWYDESRRVPRALCVIYTISHNYGISGLALKPIGDPMDDRWSAPLELATLWLKKLTFAPIGGGVKVIPLELTEEFLRRLWTWAQQATAFRQPKGKAPRSSIRTVASLLRKYSFVKPLTPTWREIYDLPKRMSLTTASYEAFYPLDNFNPKGAPDNIEGLMDW